MHRCDQAGSFAARTAPISALYPFECMSGEVCRLRLASISAHSMIEHLPPSDICFHTVPLLLSRLSSVERVVRFPASGTACQTSHNPGETAVSLEKLLCHFHTIFLFWVDASQRSQVPQYISLEGIHVRFWPPFASSHSHSGYTGADTVLRFGL